MDKQSQPPVGMFFPGGSKPSGAKRNAAGVAKSTKKSTTAPKRSSTGSSRATAQPSASYDGHSSAQDSRHKRVWKACERCRMKKTKCDGEFPCKRCKDDGLVCTAGHRKKTEYKQLPKGYAEVLEVTQLALVSTVHRLYAMVREGQSWEFGEPDLNDRGQPVIHDIAQKLSCIRPNADIDLPVHSVFPENEADLAKLAKQLAAQQPQEAREHVEEDHHSDSEMSVEQYVAEHESPPPSATSSSSELSMSDFGDYRKAAFGESNNLALSPSSLNYDSFDSGSDRNASTPSPVTTQQHTPTLSMPQTQKSWRLSNRQSLNRDAFMSNITFSGLSNPQVYSSSMPSTAAGMDFNEMLSQGLLESDFGKMKPHVLANPSPMLGIGDPMIYSGFGYDADTMRL